VLDFRNLLKEMISSELDEITLSQGNARVENLFEHFLDAHDIGFFKHVQIDQIRSRCDTVDCVKKAISKLSPKNYVSANIVETEDQYALHMVKKGDYVYFRLGNTEVTNLGEYFLGVIQVKFKYGNARFMKNSFDLKMCEVVWSNIATEYLGKGFGKIMYSLVYRYLSSKNVAFSSGTQLFEGSQKMWFNFIPTIADNFGVILHSSFFIPITKEEMIKEGYKLGDRGNVDQCIAIGNPPKLIQKVIDGLNGLSFTKGEFGMLMLPNSINNKLQTDGESKKVYFSYILDTSNSIKDLMKYLEEYSSFTDDDIIRYTHSTKKLKSLILGFDDVNIIVREENGSLDWYPI
jgi:hypothetical protein